MILSLIAALGNHNEIGWQQKLPWHVPGDLKKFKAITQHKAILMGFNTCLSLGRLLPGRFHMILSRKNRAELLQSIPFLKPEEEHAQWCLIANLDQAKPYFQTALFQNKLKLDLSELLIIGGAQVYQLSLPYCQKMYLSRIPYQGPADAFFPTYEEKNWRLIQKESFPLEENSAEPDKKWDFYHWERIQPAEYSDG